MAQVGDTMLIPGDNGVPHLFLIIWGPGVIPNEGIADRPVMMLASVSSIDPLYPHDPACELGVGDHPFIRHPSYVVYRKIKCVEAAQIDVMVASGQWPARDSASNALLHRVRTSICTSLGAKLKYQFALGC